MLTEDLIDYLAGGFRTFLVYFFLIVLLLLNVANIPLLEVSGARPAFLLAGIYFWGLTRPALLPLPLVFVLGFFLDMLAGGLVGLSSLCFLLVCFLVRGQRRFLLGQSWQVVWAGFCAAAVVYDAVGFVAYGLANMAWPSLWQSAACLVVSALIYPLLLVPMTAINRLHSKVPYGS